MEKAILITEVYTTARYKSGEEALWRKDALNYFKWMNPLYHNHEVSSGKTQNLYPLIQYRIYNNQAGLFALQEGAIQLDRDIQAGMISFKGRSQQKETWIRKQQYPFLLKMVKDPIHYEVFQYSPGDKEFLIKWKKYTPEEKKLDLEKRIRGSLLLQFFGAIDWRIQQELKVEVIDYKRPKYKTGDKGEKYNCIDVLYSCNVHLPSRMAIGRHVAYGFGLVFEK